MVFDFIPEPSDKAILNYDDAEVMKLEPGIQAETIFFSTARSLDRGISYNGNMCIRYGAIDKNLSLAGAKLQGAHNLENMLAAAAAGFLCRLPLQSQILRQRRHAARIRSFGKAIDRGRLEQLRPQGQAPRRYGRRGLWHPDLRAARLREDEAACHLTCRDGANRRARRRDDVALQVAR